MIHIRSIIIAILFIIFHADLASAAPSFPVTARLFAGLTTISPDDLNQEMTAQSLKKISNITMFGVEATYTAFPFLEYGFRYTKRYVKEEENPANASTDFSGTINQDAVLFLARLPLLKTQFLHGDIFAGVGGSNTTFTIKTATQDGELTRKETGDWFSTPCASFGGSIAAGYKSFYFVFEGGYDINKVSKFKRTGNVNTNVSAIDMSGGYISIGLLFDGISATSPHK